MPRECGIDAALPTQALGRYAVYTWASDTNLFNELTNRQIVVLMAQAGQPAWAGD
jgi:hypothetical protein